MRVCFFGNSFTQGTGDDECLGWVGRIGSVLRKQGHDLTIYNLGVRRDTSGDILARWESEANARLPLGEAARLIFSFGNNDTAPAELGTSPRLSLEQTVLNTNSILVAAKARAATFMISPIPVFQDIAHNQRIVELTHALCGLCSSIEVPFLNLSTLPPAFWDSWKMEARVGDGVHPNAKGYEDMAGVIRNWEPVVASLV
jgi:acyl-CoA thioesterase I